MAPHKTGTEDTVKQVNNILQNLRGEHFRHTRNVQGKPVSSSSLSSHAHNQPTLPIDLIYPSPAPATSLSWVPGPTPPRSWRSASTPSSIQIKSDAAWRDRALSLLFSARSGFAEVVPYIPLHLRRALLRHTAIHAPLSQTELDALCEGTTHVCTGLIVVGSHNTLHGSSFQKSDRTADTHHDGSNESSESWDAVSVQDSESLSLRSLAILSTPLSAATILTFPPTITHLVLIGIPHQISLQRLSTVCPLLVFLDLSYNAWLYALQGALLLEEVEWGRLRKLEVIGLRECLVTPKVLLELNRGRWEDVRVIQ